MRKRSSIIPATVLILLGLFFLLSNLGALKGLDLSAEELWPGFVVLAGLAFLFQYLLGARDPGLVFVGTAATLLGLFFFLFTLNVELPFEFENVKGPIDWGDSAYLWPAYPLIGGIAFVMMAILSRERDVLGVGLVAMLSFSLSVAPRDWKRLRSSGRCCWSCWVVGCCSVRYSGDAGNRSGSD